MWSELGNCMRDNGNFNQKVTIYLLRFNCMVVVNLAYIPSSQCGQDFACGPVGVAVDDVVVELFLKVS